MLLNQFDLVSGTLPLTPLLESMFSVLQSCISQSLIFSPALLLLMQLSENVYHILIDNPFVKPESIFKYNQSLEEGGVLQAVNIDLTRCLAMKQRDQVSRIALLVPLIALRKESSEFSEGEDRAVWLYSLKMAKYVSCVKNSATVRSISSNGKILSIVLAEGTIKLYSLKEVAAEQPRLNLLTSIQGAHQDLSACPFALSSECFAYVETVKDEPNVFTKLEKNLQQSSMGSFSLEAARKLLRVGELGYNTVQSLISINQATSANHAAPAPLVGHSEEDHNSETEHSPKLIHLLLVKNIAGTEVLRSQLPYFQLISSLHFSPSGELLVVGNQKSQYFFILRLYPEILRNGASQPASILYSLFRGYTPARVSSLCFSLNQRWLSIVTDHGTSHLFRLDSHKPQNPQFRSQRNREEPSRSVRTDDLRQVSHLSAFGRVKVRTSQTKVDERLVFLTHFKAGYEQSVKHARVQKSNQVKSLIVVVRQDSSVKTMELKILGDASKQHLLGGILKRNQIPSKSNYFLQTLEIQELASVGLIQESWLTSGERHQSEEERNQDGRRVEAIERYLGRSRHSFTVVSSPARLKNKQQQRRKVIKQWVSSSEIKTTSVVHTSLQQSPLFEVCQYSRASVAENQTDLSLLRSPSKRKELDAVRISLINKKPYSVKEESELNEELQISHYTEEPRMMVCRRVEQPIKGSEGLDVSYKSVSQSLFEVSLEEAKSGKVAPMFEQDISNQGVVLSQYEIQDEYTRKE